ncbi:TPA: hypothetical protein N0F65_005440 [Lagenidium giganteum]|uniref:Calmodulin n=1 Tax=Lagenidium giganteum TaxID=4803 RepID=A0AAV2YX71_9STRA|nr:TPA: hypothetical protein N0F65_005440 [Lagenidium giganteum]
MIGILVIAALSVVVPLSLCAVPSFARYTVFPVLSKLIYRFTSFYLLPGMDVEYVIGSFMLTDNRSGVRESWRGFSLVLKNLQVRAEYLKSLAFEHKGIVPIVLTACAIQEVTVHIAASWRIVVEMKKMNICGRICDPNSGAITVEDAVAQKIGEATGVINRLLQEKQRLESLAAAVAQDETKQYSFRDRVMQLIVAQFDVVVRDVNIRLDGDNSYQYALSANEESELNGSTSSSRHSQDIPATSLHVVAEKMEFLTIIKHDGREEALQRVMFSPDIRVENKLRFHKLVVSVGELGDDDDDQGHREKYLFDYPVLELNMDLPPILRLMCFVEGLAPIPFEHKEWRLELLSEGGASRIALTTEHFCAALRDFYIPYCDFGVAVRALRIREDEEARARCISDEDKTFYLKYYGVIDNDKTMPPAEKQEKLKRLQDLDEKMCLGDILHLRCKALELGTYFRNNNDLSYEEVMDVFQDICSRPENVMYSQMNIALRMENLCILFEDSKGHVGELVLVDFGINFLSVPNPQENDPGKDIEMSIGQTIMSINEDADAGPTLSPMCKLVYGDVSLDADPDSVAKPREVALQYRQYQSGRQDISGVFSRLRLVLAAGPLERYMLYQDRLLAHLFRVLAMARPAVSSDPVADSAVAEEDHKIAALAPFSMLGERLLDLNASFEDCHLVLIPQQSFSNSIYSDIDISMNRSDSGVNSRVDIPVDVRLLLRCTGELEQVELDVRKVGVIARYLESGPNDEDSEALLAPMNMDFAYSLRADASDPLQCHQNLSVTIPDVIFACSDLSLALLASSLQALSGVRFTTAEQAQIREESRLKQEELKRQAELNVVLERVQRLFDEIDEDKNGHVEYSELLLLLRRAKVGEDLLEVELEQFVRTLFNEIDEDHNGFVEFEELAHFLRADLLASDSVDSPYDGSGELNGSLNLRGGEYNGTHELERICGEKVRSIKQFEDHLARPEILARFWQLYERETRAKKASLNGQSHISVQKKLVRLLKNFEGAHLCWNMLIEPELSSEDEPVEWSLQPGIHCGGTCEYQNAAKVIAKQKKDTLFGSVMTQVEEIEQALLTGVAHQAVKKQLRFTTNVKLGIFRAVLTDTELPTQFCRGDFVLRDLKCSIDLMGKEIEANRGVDWGMLATSGSSEWTVLFGMTMAASCYSDVAEDMENIIEPWELMAGLSSNEGENGYAALVEAGTRLQVNVTPGLMKTYKSLMEVMDGNTQRTSLQKHQESFQSTLAARSRHGSECLLQNLTGCSLEVQLVGQEAVKMEPNERSYTNASFNPAETTVETLAIKGWGSNSSAVLLPTFGTVNILVKSQDGSTMFVSAFCRLDTPLRHRIVFKSSMHLCNHSTQTYDIKYLALGSETRSSFTSRVMKLRPSERLALPMTVFMGITEIYARPEGFDDWIVKANLDDEILTSQSAVEKVFEHEEAQRAKLNQRRGGSIVLGENEETCSRVVKQLAANVLVRRWHLKNHFEWEIALSPPFVVRNSLPYHMEFRFLEYTSTVKGTKDEFNTITSRLHAEAVSAEKNIIEGKVESGKDVEVAGVSCFRPGYLVVRLVTESKGWKTSWSKPLLMAIHADMERFSTVRESLQLQKGIRIDADRLSLPGYSRLVRFSTPFWVINSTSFDMAIASVVEGSRPSSFQALEQPDMFNYPLMTHLDTKHLSLKPVQMKAERPESWENLGKVPNTAYMPTSISAETLKNAAWSDPVNATAVNTIGECVCGPSVFAVRVEGLYGVFEGSLALTVSPRFFLQNRLRETISIQSFGSSESTIEKVDELFRKRGAAEVKPLQLTVRNGETMPLHNFTSLKQEPLSKCQKYISISFSDKWDNGSQWSFAIPINNTGDLYFQIFSSNRKRYMVCQASVQVVEMYVYVILSDVSVAPPYRIENYTPFSVECCQLGESSSLFSSAQKESRQLVPTGRWHGFAWHNPLSKDRHVELQLSYEDGMTKAKKYDIDQVGYHHSIFVEYFGKDGDCIRRIEVVVQVVVDENTRVLKFVEKELEMSRFENQDMQFEKEFQQRKMSFASSYDIRLAGFGFSLFDALPQEVLFASVDTIQLQKPPSSLQWTFSVFHVQVDNMLSTAKFPVIVNPVNAGYSSGTPGIKSKPFFKLVMDADLAARIGIYKLLEIQLAHLALKVDIDFLMNLLKLLEPYISSDTMVHAASQRLLDKIFSAFITKITGSLDKFVGEFAEEEPKSYEGAGKSGANEQATGIAPIDGGIKFAKDFGKGLTGIFTKPVEGAMKGGVTGLVQGTVQGIAGPGVVILKQLTSASHSIALGVQSTVVDRSPFGGRRRRQKRVEGNKIISDFDPKHYRPTRMMIEVVSAHGLIAGSSCDPKCLVRVDDRVILKTRLLYNTANPVWEEKTEIELDGSEQEVQIVVKDSYGGAIDKTLGKCVLEMSELQDDFKPPEYGSKLARWVKTGTKPDDTKMNTTNQVKSKEYVLVAPQPSGNAMSLLGGHKSEEVGDNDYQVLVTIISVRDLQTQGMGGGMLGLGNLVSSTPNIAPFVSATIGKHTNRSNVGKVKFTQAKSHKYRANIEWNETFTFPWRKREDVDDDRPVVSFALMDKSMLHDETLGYSFKEVSLTNFKLKEAQTEDLELYDRPADTGTVVGNMQVRIELVGAASSPKRSQSMHFSRTASGNLAKVGRVRIACDFV